MIEGVYMTGKELNRAEVLMKVTQKRLTQAQAAIELDILPLAESENFRWLQA